MLTFNFSRIFKIRGIDKPFRFLVKNGYSTNYATRIANNRITRIDLADLEKLCEIFQCTPHDLMQWYPGEKEASDESHPLAILKRSDNVPHLTKLLYSVPVEKMTEIENMIQEKLKE